MRFSVLSFGGKTVQAAAGLAMILLFGIAVCFGEDTKSTETEGNSSDSDSGIDFLSSSSERRVRFPDMPGSMDNFVRRRPQSMPIPPPVYAPSQRTKRLLDSRSNWGFMTPEDIIQDYLSTDSQLPDYGPDGRDRRSMSAVERYYDRQQQMRSGTNGPANHSNSFDPFGNRSRDAFGTANLFNNPTLGKMNSESGSLQPEVLSDLLGLKNNPTSAEAIRTREVQQRQMDAFRQALDFQHPVVNPALNALTQPTTRSGVSAGQSSSGFYVPPKTAFDPAAGTYNPALAVAAPIAPVAPSAPFAPGQAMSSKGPNSVSASRAGPAKPDFSIPQRRF